VAATVFPLLTNVMLPVAAPEAVGAKVTEPFMLCVGVSVSGSVKPLTLNPAPAAVTCEMTRSAVPLFLMFNICGAEAVPTFTLPNAMLVGVMAAKGAPVTPVPLKDTGATATAELLEIAMEPVALPDPVGVNVAVPILDCPGVSVSGSTNPETLKPAPEAVTAETVRFAVPEFRRLRLWLLEAAVLTLPNAILVGETASTG
jgi:hypothetical protein